MRGTGSHLEAGAPGGREDGMDLRRTRRWRTAVALAVGSALVASAACGTRVPDETEAAGGGLGGGGGPVASSGGAPGAEVEGDDPATFGSLPIPCGPGPEDRSGYGDTDVGVSADEIRIGTIADPGGPKPGLNQGVFDAMDAFVGWCNDLGGINGRRIVLTKRDGKILEYKQRVIEACDEGDFALVGGLGIFDNTGVQEQIDCGLPNVPASAVNPEQAMADLTWLGLPNPSNILETGVAQWLVDNYPDAVTRAGMQFTNTQTTQMQAERVMEGYEKVGFTWVNEQATNINETNWAPIVVTLRNEDVRFLNIHALRGSGPEPGDDRLPGHPRRVQARRGPRAARRTGVLGRAAVGDRGQQPGCGPDEGRPRGGPGRHPRVERRRPARRGRPR